MYANCLYCRTSLGTNTVLHNLSQGRLVAFDVTRGRLWILCPVCQRWNLTPLEERWETVEECEARFKSAQLIAGDGEISLARISPQFELVRIGNSTPADRAAWRYGRRLEQRSGLFARSVRSWAAVYGPVYMLLALGAFLLLPTSPLRFGAFALLASGAGLALGKFRARKLNQQIVARLYDSTGRLVTVRRRQLNQATLEPDPTNGSWSLTLSHDEGRATFAGPAAVRAIGILLAYLNNAGADDGEVARAVRLLQSEPTTEAFLTKVAAGAYRGRKQDSKALVALPHITRLALEMAAHEELERAALQDDLQDLRSAWTEAEEIASIADNMFLPAHTEEFLKKHRR